MQAISTVTITPNYSNVNGVGSVLQVYCVPIFSCPNTSALGVQAALYISSNTTTPLDVNICENGAMTTASNSNVTSTLLSAQVNSVQGQATTFTLACSYTQSNNASVQASGFTFYVVENVPNTAAIVASTPINLGTSTVSVSSIFNGTTRALSQVTALYPYQNFTKQYVNSSLSITGTIQLRGTSANTSYFGEISLYINPAYLGTDNSSQPFQVFNQSGKLGAGRTSTSSGIYTSVAIDTVIPDDYSNTPYNILLGAGTLLLGIGAQYQGASYSALLAQSSLQINEVLPLAPGGTVQAYALSGFGTQTTPYSSTLSPQYSATQPLGTWIPVPRATGSYLVFSGTLGINAISGNPSGQVLFCFYTSNSPTATPFAVRAVSAAASSSSATNHTFIPFAVVATTGVTDIPFPVYVTVCSLTTGSLVQAAEILSDFQEVFIGSLTSGINSVTAASGSYLTASTVSNAVTIGTTRASTTQAGLVAVSAAPAINNVLRVNNAGTVEFSAVPQTASFGANLFLTFGGNSVGQVRGSQIGECYYPDLGATRNVTFGGTTYPAFLVNALMLINVTTEGTSTGNATIVGMTLTPATGPVPAITYFPVEVVSGTTLPNNTVLFASYGPGSTIISLWVRNLDTETYTAATNANFQATNIQMRLKFDFYTTTPPPN
jgi:hypothetical protein